MLFDTGTAASFPDMISIPFDKKLYADGTEMEIEVHNMKEDNKTSKGLIGKGKLNLRSSITSFDQQFDLSLNLEYVSKKKTKQKGQLTLRSIITTPKAPAPTLDDSKPITGGVTSKESSSKKNKARKVL